MFDREGRMGSEIREGDRVRYALDSYEGDLMRANWGANVNPWKTLDPLIRYTVAKVDVHSWHTKVWLVEPEHHGPYNSAHFVAA